MNAHLEWSDSMPGYPASPPVPKLKPGLHDWVVRARAGEHGFVTFRVVRGAPSANEAIRIVVEHLGRVLGRPTAELGQGGAIEDYERRGFPREYILDAEPNGGRA